MNLKQISELTLGASFCGGNRVDVLKNGKRIFPAMLEAIDSAETSIDFETYVYWKGDIAETFARLLAKKAEDGVEVRVLLDAIGTLPMDSKLIKLMERSGVIVQRFRPIQNWKIWRWDNRTHRKLLLVDGKVAFTGGVGIAEEWQGDASGPDEWRDTHFRITGPVVRLMYSGFLSNWIESDQESRPYLPQHVESEIAGKADVAVIRASASTTWSDIALIVRVLISKASKTLDIATAYFVPDATITELLSGAAQRGVAIRILVPGDNTDSELSRLGGRTEYEALLNAGVEIFRFSPTMMHQKLLIVDSSLAMVGSANMNHRSMAKDDEFSLLIDGSDTLSQLEQDFNEDISRSELLDLNRWRDRPWLYRVLETFVRRFRYQL